MPIERVCRALVSVFTLAVLVSSAAFAQAPPAVANQAAAAAPRQPLPPADRLRAAMKTLQDVYGEDVSKAQDAEAKARVASEMIKGAQAEPDVVNRYALLEMGRRVAVEAGDIDLSRKAVELLAAEFAVNGEDVLQQTLAAVASKAAGERASRLVEILIGIAVEKSRTGDSDAGESLVKAAQAAARKSGRKADIERAQRALTEIRAMAKARGRAAQLRDRLKDNPGDEKSRTDLATHLCIVEDDWTAGLTLLTKSKDAALARLAGTDLATGTNSRDLMALADGWWSFADSSKGEMASMAMTRAVHHYHALVGDLRGLERTKVEKRIAAAAAKRPAGAAAPKRSRNLILHLDASAPTSLLGPDNRPLPESPRSPMPALAWLDPENLGASARQPAPGSQPVAVVHEASGLRALRFAGQQALVSPQPLPEVGTLVAVVDPSRPLAPACFVGAMTGKSGIDVWTRANGEGMFRLLDAVGKPFHISTTPDVMGRAGACLVTVQWLEPMVLRINGKLASDQKDVPAMDRGVSKGVVFGAQNDGLGNPYSGLLCECLLFDVQVPPDALLEVERTLAAKWKVGAPP